MVEGENLQRTGKVINLQMSDYVPITPSEKTDRGGWVAYGAKNLFPQYLNELADTSPVHGTLCISIGDMIAGKGLDAGADQSRIDALNINPVFYSCAHDLKKFGGFYLEVIYSTDRKTLAAVNHLPFAECRLAVNEDEDTIGIFHSSDWSATKKKRNKPQFLPPFNPLMATSEPRQCLWSFGYTSGAMYPRPDYWSAVNYIELSKQIGVYHVNNILNGLFPSFIVSFFNGQQEPDAQRKIANDWENKLSGTRNAGKFIMTFNEEGAQKPEIVPFPISDADKQYQFLAEESRKEIMVAHRVTTPLLFGIREQQGFGSNTDEMVAGLRIFNNQVIEPAQRKLLDAFTEVLIFEIPNITLVVVPNTPIELSNGEVKPTGETITAQPSIGQPTDTTAPAPDAPAPDANVAATALNGAQITSLVDIIMQTASGLLPVPSAKAIIGAAFPTLTTEQIDNIFTGVVPGSVDPNAVAMGALKIALHELSKKKSNDHAHTNPEIADELIKLGAPVPEGYVLIDSFATDPDTDEAHDAELAAVSKHYFAQQRPTRPVPGGNEEKRSEQDERIDGTLFITRYRYRGDPDPERSFCKKMMAADLLYRKEDIVAAENKVVNPGMGPYGSDVMDVWRFKGGPNCKHFFQKEVYMSTLKTKIRLDSKQTKRIAVATAERMGYKVRNPKEVAQWPWDMKTKGYLPSNPRAKQKK
jgi:hypothetical protein